MTPTTAEPTPGADPRPGPGPLDYARKGLKTLASLRLTVGLLACSIALVFFGTLAQMEFGIWTVVDQYFWSWVVWVPVDLFRQFGSVFLSEWVSKTSRWGGSFPFPAGKLLGGLMLANLLAAHLVRFRLTWKRSGVILIHAGLILLFVGEFITREYAVEQRMRIREGSSANFTEDSRHMELVFVDSSAPGHDREVSVPERMLRAKGGRVSDPELPVDVEVLDYYPNAALDPAKAGGKSNPATAGVGRGFTATRAPEVAGADAQQRVDLPAAYVRLYEKGGAELGTYLVSLQLTMMGGHDDVSAGGKTYQMTLRNIRYYKPYSIKLLDFNFDRYLGTQKAKNYSSDVVLTAPDGSERQQTIRMNDPLRYGGETFYQSSFDPDESGTVLQVVQNPGWVIPYISCVVVSVGMLVHFGIYLTQFLLRRAAA